MSGIQIHSDGKQDACIRALSKEHRLQIFVNEKKVFQVVCSPEHLTELVIGRLLTEGIIQSGNQIASLYLCESGVKAKVYLDEQSSLKVQQEGMVFGTEVETCCTDNKMYAVGKHLEAYASVEPITWSHDEVFAMAESMQEGLPLYEATHAVHSSMLSYQGKILFSYEDIGRHNALDKVIGRAVMEEVDLSKCILFSSGRAPVDMVSKVIRAGIPVFAAKGAPTTEAVQLAQRYHVTLLGNVRRDSMVMYAG